MNDEKLRNWANRKYHTSPLSMRKLAIRMGTNHSKISLVLSGKQPGDFGFYLELARAFDAVPEFLRIADILPDEGEEGALFADILAAMKELTPEERQEVLRYALFVKKERSERDTPNIGSEANAHT